MGAQSRVPSQTSIASLYEKRATAAKEKTGRHLNGFGPGAVEDSPRLSLLLY